MRQGQIVPWILGGVGTVITLISFTYGLSANIFKSNLDNVTQRQNTQEAVILKLTEIESQNATLLKVYGEAIKSLQDKQNGKK